MFDYQTDGGRGEGACFLVRTFTYVTPSCAHPIFHGIANTRQLPRMTSQSLGREII